MSIIFMGTPEFALESLTALTNAGYDIAAVFTKPDKPQGRGMKLAFSPVKEYAVKQNLTVYQPETLKDDAVYEAAAALKPEFIVVVAYGLFLPKRYLELPSAACINVHGSLLPRYRGAAPIQRVVMNGETETGVCTMHMAKEMDAGDVILSKTFAIGETDTFGNVHDKMKVLGAEVLLETLPLLKNGTAPRIVQDETLVTFAPPITKEDREIDTGKTAREAYNLIRGLRPFPCAAYRGFKIHAANLCGGGIPLKCADGEIYITELQAPGKRRVTAEEYLRGNGNFPGGDL
ncbi:MAG: methionyl-tRNA formyltransferase [Oscillospiraceae bacterium]|nr:methionyl-tRNA formyltransferase [Oscillospiraceae bacterium]